MKKQKKQLITMVIFLAFLLIAYVGLGVYNEKQEEEESEENTVVITDFDYEDVVAFSYIYNEETYHFTKSNSVWAMEAQSEFDIDESLVASMLEVACSLSAIDYYDAYESLETYGLDNPQQTVTLTFADESSVQILFGNYNEITDQYYLMVSGDENLYMVDSTLLDTFDVAYTSLEYIEEETKEDTELLTEE